MSENVSFSQYAVLNSTLLSLKRTLAAAEQRTELAEKRLVTAFVQGAQWWEYQRQGATMWASDRDSAEAEALRRLAGRTLGRARVMEGER